MPSGMRQRKKACDYKPLFVFVIHFLKDFHHVAVELDFSLVNQINLFV
jgi:hypothetical protein